MTEKACSIGLKSGEYGGRYSIRQPRDKRIITQRCDRMGFTHHNLQQVQLSCCCGESERYPSPGHFEARDMVSLVGAGLNIGESDQYMQEQRGK